ncbi:MAG TPA: hypothetical protein VMC06_04200 [Opitutaceae bacterium]|nr:hypothetical protein [Opitutaceae bacterium]
MHILESLRIALGVLTGGVIGFAFGLLQNAALRRHEQLEQTGQLQHAWSLMPRAGARVAYLLLVLALVQIICPLLFADGVQWTVSAGVGLGYGWTLFRNLRQRLKTNAL